MHVQPTDSGMLLDVPLTLMQLWDVKLYVSHNLPPQSGSPTQQQQCCWQQQIDTDWVDGPVHCMHVCTHLEHPNEYVHVQLSD
jgi:hypothetical protein